MSFTVTAADIADDRWAQLPPPAGFDGAPVIDTVDVPLCPVCGGAAFAPYAAGFDYEMQTCRNPWRFVRCAGCSHVRLHPRPADHTLGVIYPSTYYAYQYEKVVNPVALKAKAMLDALKMRSIANLRAQGFASYLDIGCGSGRFLKSMERRGVARDRLYGLELDKATVEQLRAQGYQAHCRRVETADCIPDGGIDLATMFHVIEHVHDPQAVTRNVARWLSRGGLFAVETPNTDSWDARKFKDTFWGGYHIPRHWHLFNPESLRRMFENAGLRVVRTAYLTGHSFWMFSFHHYYRYARNRARLARWFHPMHCLPTLAAFTALDKLRAACGAKTSAILMVGRKEE